MLEHLNRMAVFQAVAEAGSFRGAARRLSLSPSVVSHHVSQLEAQLGLALFYRTTRRLSLTDAGAELLGSARRMVQAGAEGLDAMQRRKVQPVGRVRVTLPSGSQMPGFQMNLAGFLRAHPGITLDLTYTDRLVELAGSDFDLAIRGGPARLPDSSYRARPFEILEIWLTASPDYVARRAGPPRAFGDLDGWDWIEFPPGLRISAFLQETVTEPPVLRSAVILDSLIVALHLCLDGVGVTALPRVAVEQHVTAGRLVRLLPAETLRTIATHLVWPANVGRHSPVQLLVDHLLADQRLQVRHPGIS